MVTFYVTLTATRDYPTLFEGCVDSLKSQAQIAGFRRLRPVNGLTCGDDVAKEGPEIEPGTLGLGDRDLPSWTK